jgi:hypothetical protein
MPRNGYLINFHQSQLSNRASCCIYLPLVLSFFIVVACLCCHCHTLFVGMASRPPIPPPPPIAGITARRGVARGRGGSPAGGARGRAGAGAGAGAGGGARGRGVARPPAPPQRVPAVTPTPPRTTYTSSASSASNASPLKPRPYAASPALAISAAGSSATGSSSLTTKPIKRGEVNSAVFRVLGEATDTSEERRNKIIEARAFAIPNSVAAQSELYGSSTVGGGDDGGGVNTVSVVAELLRWDSRHAMNCCASMNNTNPHRNYRHVLLHHLNEAVG